MSRLPTSLISSTSATYDFKNSANNTNSWYGFIRLAYQRKYPSISTAMELILGAIAGALAQIFTIPVSVVTTRQQTEETPSEFLKTGKEVIAEDGPSGLWRGLKASLVLVVNPAITYGMYQRFRNIFFAGKANLTAYDSFCK